MYQEAVKVSYELLEMEVIMFYGEDIIVTSCDGEVIDDGDSPWGPGL